MMSPKDFKIVLVDDDIDVLEISKLTLESLGYESVDFTNPEDALDYTIKNKHQISLVLSDLRMDKVNGFELKKRLNSKAKEVPFVIITGYWTKEMSSEAMELGVDAFIEKPVNESVLKEQIEKFAQARIEQLIEEQEMVAGFLDETSPMLDEIESLILELEEDPENEQTLSVYFRLLHTIKGTAACVGLTALGNYTHKYEDFIGELRNKTIPLNTLTTNVLLEGLDDLKSFFNDVKEKGNDKELDISQGIVKYSIEAIKSKSQDIQGAQSLTGESKQLPQKESKDDKKEDDKMTVPMSLLNNFMEESGELTVIRNSILKTVKKIENKFRGDKDIEMLNELLDSMYDVTSNIQGKITEMRKVPLKNTFRPFKRLIRDLSKKLDKEVELVLEGEELSVDNIVAKLFNNTLIHILRNSLDHGLETKSDRKETGKDLVGKLSIVVKEVGEEIVLQVTDDGKGINPDIIRAKALEKELYTEDELDSMSALEITNIIFDSGFSTAEQVSDLSGRGVGMDMVRSSFEEMGGSCFVQSKVGEGSTFTLSVPIPKSVLIVNTLSVRQSDHIFMFHMDEVAEVIRYEEDSNHSKMYHIDGQQILCHNDESIQLVPLKRVLSKRYSQEPEVNVDQDCCYDIVVLRLGKTKFGMIVDEIYEFEEVVSRNIADGIRSSDLFHGASQLGSGEVALILSAEGLANNIGVGLDFSSDKLELLNESMVQAKEYEHEYMTFRYKHDASLAIDLDEVERLEKFNKSQIEFVGNNFAIRYGNSLLPIIEPSCFLGLYHGQLEEKIQNYPKDLLEVIVVMVEGTKVGILVYELDEIKKCSEEMNTETVNLEGLKGSIYIDNKTISVLDINHIYNTFKNNKLKVLERSIDSFAA